MCLTYLVKKFKFDRTKNDDIFNTLHLLCLFLHSQGNMHAVRKKLEEQDLHIHKRPFLYIIFNNHILMLRFFCQQNHAFH